MTLQLRLGSTHTQCAIMSKVILSLFFLKYTLTPKYSIKNMKTGLIIKKRRKENGEQLVLSQ